MRLAAALSAALLLSGCASSSGSLGQFRQAPEGVQLAVQPSAAAPGTNVALTLYNGGAEPIGQNLCFAALEQYRGGLWVPAVSTAKGCPELFPALLPGQQAGADTPLPPMLGAGDYRFVTRVHAPLASVPPSQVRSGRFTVTAPGRE